MRTRPWPIVLLALIHILGPVGNLLLSAKLQHLTVHQFTRALSTEGTWAMIEFFLLLPIAGFAIYACKRWSYPVFLLVGLQTAYNNIAAWHSAGSAIFPLWLLVLLIALDVVLVTYFLLPTVRITYMDPSVRWWESKPRFLVRMRARLNFGEKTIPCTITDFSEGGVFVRSREDLSIGTEVLLNFKVIDREFSVPARIVYKRKLSESKTSQGFGVQFLPGTEVLHDMRRLAHGMAVAGLAARNRTDLAKDFRNWVRRAIHGQGWLPELPARQGKRTS